MKHAEPGISRATLARWSIGLALAVALIAAPSTPALAGHDDWEPSGTPDFEWSGAIKPGQVVEIKGVNGSVIAGATSGDKVEIRAWKHARHSDPSQVKIEMVPHAGGVTVCSMYPTPFGSRPNSCEPGDGGNMNTRNNDVEVRYVIRVPAGVAFHGRTINGGITAVGLSGPVDAQTVNGSVQVTTSGRAQAQTVNGSIRAALGARDWQDPIEFETVNGGIEVSMSSDINADLDAQTVNGSIDSDLPMLVHGRIGRTHMRGTINKGGSTLRLKTVNGGIRIRSGT